MSTCPVCGAGDRPVLADWCSGAGGAGHGYQLAGFHVVGFDTKPQPRYPGCSVRFDVMHAPLTGFDAYHASPPCVDHIRSRTTGQPRNGTGWLLAAVRERLQATGRPWVIENVPGAPLRADYVLCGCMYGLTDGDLMLRRERWFETSWGGYALRASCVHDRQAVSVIRQGAYRMTARPEHGRRYIDTATSSRLMGIGWMTKHELGDAVPPAYTADLGRDLMDRVNGDVPCPA